MKTKLNKNLAVHMLQQQRIIWYSLKFGGCRYDAVLRACRDTDLGGAVIKVFDTDFAELIGSEHIRFTTGDCMQICLEPFAVAATMLKIFDSDCTTKPSDKALQTMESAEVEPESDWNDSILADPRLAKAEINLLRIHRNTISDIKKEMEAINQSFAKEDSVRNAEELNH